MTEYLLDTNICIYIIKKKPLEVFKKFRELQPGNVAISSADNGRGIATPEGIPMGEGAKAQRCLWGNKSVLRISK